MLFIWVDDATHQEVIECLERTLCRGRVHGMVERQAWIRCLQHGCSNVSDDDENMQYARGGGTGIEPLMRPCRYSPNTDSVPLGWTAA